jgi:DNA repair exonuclease SbcCD ATPase subunit
MASQFDASEFVDDDFQTARAAQKGVGVAMAADPNRAPSREEVDSKVGQMHEKLAELKRVQQELERERSLLEETRRRQVELTTGREEMLQNLTRGIGLLDEAEFAARRDAEQMSKTLTELRDALTKVQGINEETWTKDDLNVELTRALTTVENARLEWNAARLKFPLLSTPAVTTDPSVQPGVDNSLPHLLQQQSWAQLCKLGLALTWPVALTAIAIVVVLLLRTR